MPAGEDKNRRRRRRPGKEKEMDKWQQSCQVCAVEREEETCKAGAWGMGWALPCPSPCPSRQPGIHCKGRGKVGGQAVPYPFNMCPDKQGTGVMPGRHNHLPWD